MPTPPARSGSPIAAALAKRPAPADATGTRGTMAGGIANAIADNFRQRTTGGSGDVANSQMLALWHLAQAHSLISGNDSDDPTTYLPVNVYERGQARKNLPAPPPLPVKPQ